MNGGTDVDLDELHTFASGLVDRAGRTAGAAERVGGGAVDQLSDAFGWVALAFAAGAVDSARRAASGIGQLGTHLAEDAGRVRDSAAHFDATNEDNANRFRRLDHG